MTRTLRPLAALALAGLIGLVSAGCGSNTSPKTGGASSASSTDTASAGSTSSGADKKLTKQEKAVKFAECMRAHGVRDFPDPTDENAHTYGVSVTPAVWLKANKACKDFAAPGSMSGKRTHKQQSASLRFAQCVREHGVKDFPDPVNGEPLVDTTQIPSSNRPGGMDILNAAMRKCGDVLGDVAGGQG